MRKRKVPTLLVVALAMAASAVPAGPAGALTVAEVRARLESVKADLREIDQKLDDGEHRLDDAEQAILKHRRALQLADRRREHLRQAMNQQAIQMYVLGSADPLQMAGIGDLGTLIDRMGYLEQIRRGEQGLLEEIRTLQRRSATRSKQLAIERANARAARDQLERQHRRFKARMKELAELTAFLEAASPRRTGRASRSGRGFICPVGGPSIVSRNFGDPRPGGPHQGNDIRASAGQPVRSVGPARVVETPSGSWWGIGIVIRDPAGTEWWYAHLSTRYVRVGDRLSPGEVIGRVGCTGRCYGNHLHFEWHPGGGPARDPYRLLAAAC